MIERAEVEHSILLAGSRVPSLDGRMESSLLGRNVTIARDDAPAARLPLHGRRQLARSRSCEAARHRRGAGCSATRSSRAARARRPRGRRARPARVRHHRRRARRSARDRARLEPRRGRQLRGVDGRRRRRGRRDDARSRSTPTAPATSRARCAGAGARLVHVSTDYVFDGDASASRRSSPTRPARSAPTAARSSHGERARARRASPDHAIVRTAWLFGPTARTSSTTMLRLAAERDEVQVVTDQVGCPTFAGHLAPALVDMAERADTGHLPRRRRGRVLVVRARRSRSSRRRRRRAACCRRPPSSSPAPRRAPPTACWAPSASDPMHAAAVAGGRSRPPGRLGGGPAR